MLQGTHYVNFDIGIRDTRAVGLVRAAVALPCPSCLRINNARANFRQLVCVVAQIRKTLTSWIHGTSKNYPFLKPAVHSFLPFI